MSDTNAAKAKKPEAEGTTTEAEAPVVGALLASNWKARESGVFFNTHEVVAEAGTPLAHLEEPAFWANVSQKFRAGDTILAFPRDGSWYAELTVWDAGQNWAQVSVKASQKRPAFKSVPGVADDFAIARDPINGVVIRRRSTGATVKAGFASHEDARRWIMDHQRALRN